MVKDQMPIYKDEQADYLDLTDLPFFVASAKGDDLLGVPVRFRRAGNKGYSVLFKRMYRLGELYALSYMHRLYINHNEEIYNDLTAHLRGDCTAYDMWGGGELDRVVTVLSDKKGVFPEKLLSWVKAGFYDSLQRFLIMSVLDKNAVFNPANKLAQLKQSDISAMISDVLHDKAPANFPFHGFEGWDLGT